jgi:chromosomal replication initiation ATPase DnaA
MARIRDRRIKLEQELLIPLDDILDEICMIFKVKPTEILSKSKSRNLTQCREIFAYITIFLPRKHAGVRRIAAAMLRDHTSAVSMREKIRDYIVYNDAVFSRNLDIYKSESKIFKKIASYYFKNNKTMDYVRVYEDIKQIRSMSCV